MEDLYGATRRTFEDEFVIFPYTQMWIRFFIEDAAKKINGGNTISKLMQLKEIKHES